MARAEQQRIKWQASPEGQDWQARIDSNYKNTIIISFTGNRFYRGMLCKDDCSGHIQGWNWAQQNEFDDYGVCDEAKSLSFYEGCMKGVEEIREFIEEQERTRGY